MVINEFQRFGGKHSETGSLAKLLAHLGAVNNHSGQPFTEELLFGIGGGIGFAYFLFERHGAYPIHLGTRIHTKETEHPEFLETICKRLGVPCQVQNSSSASAAGSNMERDLDMGRPPIVWTDSSRLPYLGLSTGLNTHHALVVYGLENSSDKVMFSDRCPGPVTLTREQFRNARESSWSPKYRAMLVRPTNETKDVKAAIIDGIRECAQQMNEGLGITNFGLTGMEKWATVLTSLREKKSWLKIFPPGPGLFDALFSLFSQIRLNGTGNAHRGYYADFLDQASDIIDKPDLKQVATLFRHSDRMWSDLADAHLPAGVPQFEEIRRLSLERETVFEQQGLEGFDEIQRLKARVDGLVTEMRQQFPLGVPETKALLTDLRLRILRLKEHEAEAVRALQDAVGPAPAPVQQEEPVQSEHEFLNS
jgi:hypothetical protein